MKKKLLIIAIFMFLIYLTTLFDVNSTSITCNKYSSFVNNTERKISIDEHKYKILVYYPESEFDVLNKEITKKIDKYIYQFKDSIKDINVQPNIYYTLDIIYNTYEYKNYISYVFHVDYYTGGAHPNHELFTIIYNKHTNTIIDINSLIKLNPNILNTFSSISRKELLNNKDIVDSNMMFEGTKPTLNNFSNFAFSKDGLIIFFEYYQVAPYSSGEFQVIIPYDKLNLSL